MDTTTSTEKIRDLDLVDEQQLTDLLTAPFPPRERATYSITAKRAFDVFVASLVLVTVLSWLYPLLYVLIRMGSKGSPIFIQKRIGYQGRVFNCYKFRSMYVSGDKITGAPHTPDRITPIGKWLRKSCLDELPQMINVLLGDMSIVGPRPHMLLHHYQFSSLLPDYNERHNVRPGITGLAQVRGFHGTIMDYHCIYGRTRLDLFYIRKASLWLDIKICFSTASFLLPLNRKP